MRVVQVSHYMPPHEGGIERVAASLATGLRARGHEVTWFAAATPAPSGRAGFDVRLSASNVLETKMGIPMPLPDPRELGRLAAAVASADVTLVHDCLYPTSLTAALAARSAAKPCVLLQHVGHVPYGRLDPVQTLAHRTLGRATIAACSRHLAVSPHVAAYFASIAPRVPFEVVTNGIDLNRFHPPNEEARARARDAFGIPGDARVVLFVGRLVPKKGVARVASIASTLAARGLTLVVAGEGPMAPLLASTPVIRLGHVAADAMPSLYATADVLLLPSRGEGFPLTVQESRATGVPSVVSDDASFLTNLQGRPGVAFEHDDEGLVTSCVRLATKGDLRTVIADDARAAWGLTDFLDAHERILAESARAR